VSVTEFHRFLPFNWGQFGTSDRKILGKKFDFAYSGMIKNIFFYESIDFLLSFHRNMFGTYTDLFQNQFYEKVIGTTENRFKMYQMLLEYKGT
jgi:hypothetical protein